MRRSWHTVRASGTLGPTVDYSFRCAAAALSVRRQPLECSGSLLQCGDSCFVIYMYMYFSISTLSLFRQERGVPTKKKGQPPREVYLGMTCKNVQKLGGYRLSQDSPSMFTDKPDFLVMDREFPDEEYPEGADGITTPAPVPGTSTGEGSSAEVQQVKEQTKNMLVRMHTELVKMATKSGISDLCALDKGERVENVLQGITSQNLKCKFCSKTLSSVTHLKNHIRGQHLHKTAHFCGRCNRYFSEATTLRRHEAKHDAASPKFKCGRCPKEFTSQSKLDDHFVVHIEAKVFRCQFCQEKDFKRVRALKAHEDICDQNPNKKPRVKCRLCEKDFKERRLMKRHFKVAHPGEDPDL